MREAWTSGRELCCSQSHQQEFEAGVGETENRCLVSSPRVPMRPALPEASSQGRDGRWAAACSGETCSPGRETCSPGNLLSGVGRCEMTQAPHASLRGFLHLGSRCGSAADLWSVRGCSRAQAAWLAPATATVAPASLGLGKPIKDPWLWGQSVSTKQLMSAVCWVDSRYPEVRDSTQEVKAETEPLR